MDFLHLVDIKKYLQLFNPDTVSCQNVVRIRYAVSVSKNNLEY